MKQQIEKKLKRKTNPELVNTIIKLKKNEKWINIAHQISMTRINKICVNLDDINNQSKENDKILVPGKVLGDGNIDKKIKITALNFSESALKKLKENKIEFNIINEEFKKNPEFKNIKIINKRLIRWK